MRKKTIIDLLFLAAVILVFFQHGCRNTGVEPFGPLSDSWFEGWNIASGNKPGPITFRISSSELAASSDETAIVEILVSDTTGNKPANFEAVTFSITNGTITASDTTDNNGVARAIVHASPINGTAVVTASCARHNYSGTDSLHYTGSSVSVYSLDTVYEVPAVFSVTVTVKNGRHEAVSGQNISLEGMIDTSLTSDSNGIAVIELYQGKAGRGNIIVRAINDSSLISFNFIQPEGIYNSGYCPECRLTLSVQPASLTIQTADSAIASVVVVDRTGSPVVRSLVGFTASSGAITGFSSTDDNGVAQAVYHAKDIVGQAVIAAWLAGYQSVADSALITINLRALQK